MINNTVLISGENVPSPYMFPILQNPIVYIILSIIYIFLSCALLSYCGKIIFDIYQVCLIKTKIYKEVDLKFSMFSFYFVKFILFTFCSSFMVTFLQLIDIKKDMHINILAYIIEIFIMYIITDILYLISYRKDYKDIKNKVQEYIEKELNNNKNIDNEQLNTSNVNFDAFNLSNNKNINITELKQIDYDDIWGQDKYKLLKKETTQNFLNSLPQKIECNIDNKKGDE